MANIKKINGMNIKDEEARNKINTLEEKAHEHDNKDILDTINQEKIDKWDGKLEQEALDDYYNKGEVDQKIANVATGGTINLDGYQEKTDENLETDNKTVVGAINELNEKIENVDVEVDLSDYATKTYVNNSIANMQLGESTQGLCYDHLTCSRMINDTLDETIINQEYLGGYIEIQPDSWDGEKTATDSETKTWGFPYSLQPSERNRLRDEMLNGTGYGLMFIRLPLGFAYRGFRNINESSGLAENTGERFKGQNKTLKTFFEKIAEAGGGLAPEYWCPPPHWVTSGTYHGNNELWAGGTYDRTTKLSSIKSSDSTQYNNQIELFTDAIVDDLEYLHENIAPVRMFGLQNEPSYPIMDYGACAYDETTYNDVLSILYPKIQASETLSWYNDEPNTVKLLVASSDEKSPFTGIASTFISNHSDWIWGYTHHSMRKASGEAGAGYGADWYKSSEFIGIKGNKSNVFINEYEYFDNNYGSDEFRCSNNMLHLINEAVYGEAKVLHPVIHLCKPLGQTLAATNTKGYCLFAVNLKDEFGIDVLNDVNTYGLAKGTYMPNNTMYNAWHMFSENLPIHSYLIGEYKSVASGGGWCAYKHGGRLYIFMANNSADNLEIKITFGANKILNGKAYNLDLLGEKIQVKKGTTISFKIPAYSGQVWISDELGDITDVGGGGDIDDGGDSGDSGVYTLTYAYGGIASSDGQNEESTVKYRSDFIDVTSYKGKNVTIKTSNTTGIFFVCRCYDENKNYLANVAFGRSLSSNFTETLPDTVSYIRVVFTNSNADGLPTIAGATLYVNNAQHTLQHE